MSKKQSKASCYEEVKYLRNGRIALKNQDQLWGVFTVGGKEVVPCCYQDIATFNEGLCPVANTDGIWGYIDRNGNEAIPFQFENARQFTEGLAPACINGLWGYINQNAEWVVEATYDKAYCFGEGLAVVGKNKESIEVIHDQIYPVLWGYIDKKGKLVVPCQYEEAFAFHDGLAQVYRDGCYGFINPQGEEVIPCDKWGEVPDDLKEGLCSVAPVLHSPHAFINRWGQEVIGGFYGAEFSEGLCSVGLSFNGNMGYINKQGKFMIPRNFDCGLDFTEGRAYVMVDDKWGVIDKMGEFIFEPTFPSARDFEPFSLGVSKVRLDGTYGAIDRYGVFVLAPIYKDFVVFKDRFVCITNDGEFEVVPRKTEETDEPEEVSYEKFLSSPTHQLTIVKKRVGEKRYYGFVDKDGTEVIPCKYDEVGYCGSLYKVKEVGGFHLYDDQGQRLTSHCYDNIYDFQEGLCAVEKNLLWGFINEKGKEVVAPHYHHASIFCEGMCRVAYEGKFGYINKQGVEVVPIRYDYAHDFRNGVARVENEDYEGFIDKTGQEVSPDQLKDNQETPKSPQEFLVIQRNKKYGVVNALGEVVVPFKFDHIYILSGVIIAELNGRSLFYNRAGKRLKTERQYDNFWTTDCGDSTMVMKDNLTGCINSKGKEFIECIYDKIEYWELQNRYVLYKDEKVGVVDLEGNPILPLAYKNVHLFKDRIIAINTEGKFEFFDLNGQKIA